MSFETMQAAKTCRAQVRDLLLKASDWLTADQIFVQIVGIKRTTLLTELHHMSKQELLEKQCDGNGHPAKYKANHLTAEIKDKEQRAKRDVLQDAEPQETAFKPMYASAIALPRQNEHKGNYVPPVWAVREGADDHKQYESRGF